jgi:hypothetical protein
LNDQSGWRKSRECSVISSQNWSFFSSRRANFQGGGCHRYRNHTTQITRSHNHTSNHTIDKRAVHTARVRPHCVCVRAYGSILSAADRVRRSLSPPDDLAAGTIATFLALRNASCSCGYTYRVLCDRVILVKQSAAATIPPPSIQYLNKSISLILFCLSLATHIKDAGLNKLRLWH